MAYAPAGAARPRMSPSAAAQRSNAGSRNGRKAAVPPTPARKTSTTFLAGLGVGLALGAAVALLLAPRTGAATREAIRNRGRRARNKASDAWEDLRLELLKTRRAIKRKKRDEAMREAEAAP